MRRKFLFFKNFSKGEKSSNAYQLYVTVVLLRPVVCSNDFFIPSCTYQIRFPVTYLFRTVGQVLGVAISSAIVQSVVQRDLVRTITGPEAQDVSDHPPSLERYCDD